MTDKINIAIKATQKLFDIHINDAFHNELNSKAFTYNYCNDEVELNFLNIFVQNCENISYDKLQYLSPEQTGRINRSTDYRTDLYSFGIVLFKLFTKKCPFEHKDPIQLIHSHIAQTPKCASEVNLEIPKSLSMIINKLLLKDPDDRYQSANGLSHDLKQVLEQFEKNDFLEFELASKDISHRPNIPQKTYGRNKEVEVLFDSFDTVVKTGKKKLVNISGYAGIGKSTLIQKLDKPIRNSNAYFLKGKFEQYTRNVPYHGIICALKDFINYILLEKESKIKSFKKKLEDNLGENIKLICEIIPELEYIISVEKSLPVLNPQENQNRFNLTFLNFIKTVCKFDNTVVLCLDDMQWADSATIKILQNVMEETALDNIFIILSYRNNEVKISHPLSLMFEELNHKKINHTSIELKPLLSVDVNHIVSDTLNLSLTKCKGLSKLIKEKTSGNPFFTKEFIHNLYDEKLLKFDIHTLEWTWNIDKIKEQNITDNVVDLMLKKLSNLSPDSTEVLKFSACLGSKTIKNITNILGISEKKVKKAIQESIEQSILIPIIKKDISSVDYKFSHDKVQEAIYSLLSHDEKERFHLKIGRYLLKSIKNERKLNRKIFDITDHLNAGSNKITQKNEKEDLAFYNFDAAIKAKESNAYDNAIVYLNKIFSLVDLEDAWSNKYDFILNVYTLLCEVYYLNLNFTYAEKCFKEVLKNAQQLDDTIEICQIQIYSLIAQNKMQESLDLGLDVLNKIGIHLPKEDDMMVYYPSLFSSYNDKKISDLIHLNTLKNSEMLNALDILNSIMAPAYLAAPVLYPKICYVAVKLCIKNGICAASANVFSVHALLLCGFFNQYNQGFAFSKLSQKIVSKFNAKEYSCKVEMISNACVTHWNKPIRNTLQPLKKSILIGIDNGDLEYSCYSAMYYCLYSLLSGRNIDELLVEFNSYLNLMKELKQEYQIYYLSIWNQFLINLKSNSSNPTLLEGEFFSEKKDLEVLQESNNISTLYCFHLAKAMLGLFNDDLLTAFTNIKKAKEYLIGVSSLYHFSEFYFYEALIVYKYYKEYVDLSKKETLLILENNHNYYESLSITSPQNNEYKIHLIRALISSINDDKNAWSYFELASQESLAQKFTHTNALCNMFAADYWFELHMDDFANTYIQKAHDGFTAWGSNAIVDVIEKKYPKYFIQKNDVNEQFNLSNFDFESVMKASQAISEEISLEELLNKIMRIIVENSGSQLGFLLLQHKQNLLVEVAYDIVTKAQTKDLKTVISMPKSIINYVKRTKKVVIYGASSKDKLFESDPYILSKNPKSIFCLPILYKKEFLGVLYLENRDIFNLYTEDKIEFLKLLSNQAAISIDHAKLFKQTVEYSNTLEQTVDEKTKELQLAVEELRVYATVDAMTGLNNRRYFFELATVMFYNAKQSNKALYSFVLDIDDFKVINDTYGHSIGDQAIKAFANTLKTYNNEDCIVGRFGGDEFVILYLTKDKKDITDFVDELKQNVLDIELDYASNDIRISTSVGVSSLNDDINSLDELILEADKKMYQDKSKKSSRKAARQRV